MEKRIVQACLDAGGLEAMYCTTDFLVDGLDGETSMACMQFLSNIVRKNLEPPSTGLTHEGVRTTAFKRAFQEEVMAIDEIVGDSIDRAVNIEMRFRAGLPRGVTYPLYEAARKKQKKPLTWLAAKLLKDRVKRGPATSSSSPAPARRQACPRARPTARRARRRSRARIEFGLGGKPILISEARNMPAVDQVDRGGRHRRRRRGRCSGSAARARLRSTIPLGDAAGKKARRASSSRSTSRRR